MDRRGLAWVTAPSSRRQGRRRMAAARAERAAARTRANEAQAKSLTKLFSMNGYKVPELMRAIAFSEAFGIIIGNVSK